MAARCALLPLRHIGPVTWPQQAPNGFDLGGKLG